MLTEKTQPMRAIATYVNICAKKISHESVLSGISTKRIFVALSHVCWLAPCLVSFGNAHATTVIAVTTDNSAFIGADSRTDPHGTICKIVVGNGVAVGMSGLLADSATHFRAATTINSLWCKSGFTERKRLRNSQESFVDFTHGDGHAHAAGKARRFVDCAHRVGIRSGTSVLSATE